VRKADNLPPSCADVKKSGGLNLLEPCGPVQACDGTALHFYDFCCVIDVKACTYTYSCTYTYTNTAVLKHNGLHPLKLNEKSIRKAFLEMEWVSVE
jgi:hypothetical protein